MKNFLFLINKTFQFLLKDKYKLVAERRVPLDGTKREASKHLQNPDWWCLLDKIRTYFEQNPDADF